jgi:hypothetical protein
MELAVCIQVQPTALLDQSAETSVNILAAEHKQVHG